MCSGAAPIDAIERNARRCSSWNDLCSTPLARRFRKPGLTPITGIAP
jgi:hypothetical protein